MAEFAAIVAAVKSGRSLEMAEMADAISQMMSGNISQPEMAEFLLALRSKGESVEEIAGAASAMRAHMVRLQPERSGLVDTCGTGGSGSGIFNVSTTAAIIAAGAGIPIAKHGNRKITSRSGSADALQELGVNIEASVPTIERCIREVGLGFCFAPLFHSAMRHVAPVRKSLTVPTIFNILGPLCNPAGAEYQMLGVGAKELQPKLAAALQKLGVKRAIVLHSQDGLCEISNSAPTDLILVTPHSTEELTIAPEDFGVKRSERAPLVVAEPIESAKIIRGILAGERGATRDIALLNAAAAIWLTKEKLSWSDAATLAAESIDSGKAKDKLRQLVELTSSQA